MNFFLFYVWLELINIGNGNADNVVVQFDETVLREAGITPDMTLMPAEDTDKMFEQYEEES